MSFKYSNRERIIEPTQHALKDYMKNLRINKRKKNAICCISLLKEKLPLMNKYDNHQINTLLLLLNKYLCKEFEWDNDIEYFQVNSQFIQNIISKLNQLTEDDFENPHKSLLNIITRLCNLFLKEQ